MKKEKKDNAYKQEVLAAVFGDSYKPNSEDPEKGITLKNRPDYTQPKDKWKVGRQLKELQKLFPHDRVLQRMVHEEFKKN